MRDSVAAWGWLAPLVFIGIQALQVIVSPIPGEITGPVGGALFGTTWGVVYSTIGLTIGTLICFGLGGSGASRSSAPGSASTTGTG